MSYLNFIATTELAIDKKVYYKIINDKQEYLGTLQKISIPLMLYILLYESNRFIEVNK